MRIRIADSPFPPPTVITLGHFGPKLDVFQQIVFLTNICRKVLEDEIIVSTGMVDTTVLIIIVVVISVLSLLILYIALRRVHFQCKTYYKQDVITPIGFDGIQAAHPQSGPKNDTLIRAKIQRHRGKTQLGLNTGTSSNPLDAPHMSPTKYKDVESLAPTAGSQRGSFIRALSSKMRMETGKHHEYGEAELTTTDFHKLDDTNNSPEKNNNTGDVVKKFSFGASRDSEQPSIHMKSSRGTPYLRSAPSVSDVKEFHDH